MSLSVRRAMSLAQTQIRSAKVNPQAASFAQRRGLAGAAGNNQGNNQGAAKVNFWQDPMNPRKWKDEQHDTLNVIGWGLFIYGAYKLLTSETVLETYRHEEARALLLAIIFEK